MGSTSADVAVSARQETPKTPTNIIYHDSKFRVIWDWIILTLIFYTAIMVPYNVAFRNKTTDDIPLLVVNSIVDIMFFIDIILNFHTTYVGATGEVVTDLKMIRINYLKTWFVIDLLACLPYDVFTSFGGDDDEEGGSMLSTLKVLRLLRLGKVARNLDKYMKHRAAMYALLLGFYLLVAHWLACGWYGIGRADADNGLVKSWVKELGDNPTRQELYTTAFYYTLSCLTSVGFGNVAAGTLNERIFTICMMIISVVLYAVMFGYVITVVQQMSSGTSNYHNMHSDIKEFMRLHKVPKDINKRVMSYIDSAWALTKGFDANKMLAFCSDNMKADIAIHLNRHVFDKHEVFKSATEGCIGSFAKNLTSSHLGPDDILYHAGDPIDSLCFVISGSLEVLQGDKAIAIVEKGDVIGDTFWKNSVLSSSAVTVKALSYCDVHEIKHDKLLEILNNYPGFAKNFAKNLSLSYNLRHKIGSNKLTDISLEGEVEKRRIQLQNQENVVSKIFSKFRKDNQAHSVPLQQVYTKSDVEKGSGSMEIISVNDTGSSDHSMNSCDCGLKDCEDEKELLSNKINAGGNVKSDILSLNKKIIKMEGMLAELLQKMK